MKENLKDKLRKDIRFQRFMVDFGSLILKKEFFNQEHSQTGVWDEKSAFRVLLREKKWEYYFLKLFIVYRL